MGIVGGVLLIGLVFWLLSRQPRSRADVAAELRTRLNLRRQLKGSVSADDLAEIVREVTGVPWEEARAYADGVAVTTEEENAWFKAIQLDEEETEAYFAGGEARRRVEAASEERGRRALAEHRRTGRPLH